MAQIKSLVIVESPAKVKTINKILGDKYKVMSSMGHLIDLPKSTLGIDLEKSIVGSTIEMNVVSWSVQTFFPR